MRFVRQFFFGVSSVLSSFRKVRGRVYGVIVLLCLVLFGCGVALGTSMFSLVKGAVLGLMSSIELPAFLPEAMPGVFGWIGGVAAWLVAVFLVGIIGGSVIMLVLSPLLSRVSDDGWTDSGHARPNDSVSDTLRSIVRGVGVALRCLLLQLICLLLLLVLSLFPLVGAVTPVLGVLVSSFFYGQSLLDYAVERAEQSGAWGGRRSGSFPFSNIGLTAGIGFLFAVLTLVPFIGSYFALFVAPAAAYAGGSALGGVVKTEG